METVVVGVPDRNGGLTSWVKSRRCEASSCVEVAIEEDKILVRNSTEPHGHVLSFTADEWVAFVGGVRDGDFDLGLVDTQPAR